MKDIVYLLFTFIGISCFGFGMAIGTMNANQAHQAEMEAKPKMIEFCEECCFSSAMNNRVIYTCAKTKEMLFRKMP